MVNNLKIKINIFHYKEIKQDIDIIIMKFNNIINFNYYLNVIF